jgi:hypothetical protein
MSRGRDDDVGKMLGSWLGKAKQIAEPPPPSEVPGSLNRAEQVGGHSSGEEALSQLNFKISNRLKKRIKQLAVRDNITLLTMLAHMVELYEKEHGKLGTK